MNPQFAFNPIRKECSNGKNQTFINRYGIKSGTTKKFNMKEKMNDSTLRYIDKSSNWLWN